MEKKIVHVVLEVFKDFDSDGNEKVETRVINWFKSFEAASNCCRDLEKRFGYSFSRADVGISLSYKIHSVRNQGIRMANYAPFKPIK